MATISRLLRIIGLSCKLERSLLKRVYSAKETYNFVPLLCWKLYKPHPIALLAALFHRFAGALFAQIIPQCNWFLFFHSKRTVNFFFFSWAANTQLNHWTKRMVSIRLITQDPRHCRGPLPTYNCRPATGLCPVTKNSAQCLWVGMHPRANRTQPSSLANYQGSSFSNYYCTGVGHSDGPSTGVGSRVRSTANLWVFLSIYVMECVLQTNN